MKHHDLHQFIDHGTLYLSAPEAAELVRRKGLANCLSAMAANIDADFQRWGDFDKTARVANHSQYGVIELMPVSDGETYAFKYLGAEGQWLNEPEADAAPNEWGEHNSLLEL